MHTTDAAGRRPQQQHAPQSHRIAASVLCGAVLLGGGAGCTTAMLHMPDGATFTQPKDVSFDSMEYKYDTVSKTYTLTVKKYSSNANEAIISKQMDFMTGVMGAAAGLAAKSAVK